MKLTGLIKCPHCGSTNIHVYQYTRVDLWDDEHHQMLNNQYPNNNNELYCDTIIYKCKCDEEDCDKYFTAKLELKCEVENVTTVPNEHDLVGNYLENL